MAIVRTRPVVATIAEVVAALAAVFAASLGFVNHDKISKVQVNVDGRMDAALKEIGELKKAVIFEKTQPAEDE